MLAITAVWVCERSRLRGVGLRSGGVSRRRGGQIRSRSEGVGRVRACVYVSHIACVFICTDLHACGESIFLLCECECARPGTCGMWKSF